MAVLSLLKTMLISTRPQCDNIEILTVNLGKLAVTSVYKPPGSTFAFEEPETFSHEHVNVLNGDFNSHSTSWGYQASNEDGNLLEDGQRYTIET